MKRLPERRLAYLRELRYALWVPVYLICFFLLERLITDGYWATQLPLDRLIPFCPVFVVFYCLWYPLLVAVGLYLLAADRAGFRRYMAFLAASFFLSLLIWFLAPQRPGPAAGPDGPDGSLLPLDRRAVHRGHQHQRVPLGPCGGVHRRRLGRVGLPLPAAPPVARRRRHGTGRVDLPVHRAHQAALPAGRRGRRGSGGGGGRGGLPPPAGPGLAAGPRQPASAAGGGRRMTSSPVPIPHPAAERRLYIERSG